MSVPGQAWKMYTAPEALRDFSCGQQYQGTAHLKWPIRHHTTHRFGLMLHLYQSENKQCVCVGGGALTAGCQNKALWYITQSKHLIHPCSDGSDSLINVPAFSINKRPVKALVHLFIMRWNSAKLQASVRPTER